MTRHDLIPHVRRWIRELRRNGDRRKRQVTIGFADRRHFIRRRRDRLGQ